ncbi:MAG: cytoplasmic protein [Micromonosporaceae bacterium]
MRVLEYRDTPGGKTSPHRHPDSVMYTLSGFQRRLRTPHGTRDVVMEPGRAHWLPAQTHAGENIGATGTHVLFIELKDTTARLSGASSGAAAVAARGHAIGHA